VAQSWRFSNSGILRPSLVSAQPLPPPHPHTAPVAPLLADCIRHSRVRLTELREGMVYLGAGALPIAAFSGKALSPSGSAGSARSYRRTTSCPSPEGVFHLSPHRLGPGIRDS
jgi:hypothetical protein